MIKRKKKHKNPTLKYEIEEILADFYPNFEDIDIKYLAKGFYGKAFKLEIKSRKLYKNTILQPGKYVVKILLEQTNNDSEGYWYPLDSKSIKKFELLSKYGLIPKIYYIDKYITIMKFIEGDTLENVLNSNPTRFQLNKIIDKIEYLISKWKKLGFIHGDLRDENIIITNSGKIYFIDPIHNFENKVWRIGEDPDKNYLNELKNNFKTN